jgi:beta-lactam-binding protein with PASTA domain
MIKKHTQKAPATEKTAVLGLSLRQRWASIRQFITDNRKIFILIFLYFTLFLVVSSIILMILTKPEGEVKIPDVTGKKFTVVYGMLSRKELKPIIKFYDTFDVEDGVILGQYPEPGSVVAEGDRIKLTVSRNNLVLDVPSLIGLDLPIAKNKVRNLHVGERTVSLGIGVVSYIPSSKTGENIVLDQSPKAGEKVTPEQKINILVSAGQIGPDMKMPDLAGQSIDLAFPLMIAKGASVAEEIVPAADINGNGRIISQEPAKDAPLVAGQLVKLKIAYYPKDEHFYTGYEKVSYQIPDDEKSGLYEAYIDDYNPKRVAFSLRMKPGQTIQFVFHRMGNARVLIMRDKKPMKVIPYEVQDF